MHFVRHMLRMNAYLASSLKWKSHAPEISFVKSTFILTISFLEKREPENTKSPPLLELHSDFADHSRTRNRHTTLYIEKDCLLVDLNPIGLSHTTLVAFSNFQYFRFSLYFFHSSITFMVSLRHPKFPDSNENRPVFSTLLHEWSCRCLSATR